MAEPTNIIMYLIDTNIWLERLLNQERADEVAQFLNQIPTEHFMITDFTFHSIGVILSRHEEHETLLHFTQDVIVDSAVTLVTLYDAIDMPRIVEIMTLFMLYFDDAYGTFDSLRTFQKIP